MHHQQIENARQLKNMHHTNAMKAREFYHSECQRVSAMEKTMRELGSEMNVDERKQMESDIAEGRKMVQAAEKEYRRAIDVLNGVTRDWIESWRSTCNIFQEMEERRIRYIHGSLRSYASILSSVYLIDEQCCDRITTTLELTDVQRDMDEFSMRFGTGTEMPEMLQFEPYAFETYEEAEDPSAQVSPASSMHDDEGQERSKSEVKDRDQQNDAVAASDSALLPAAPPAVVSEASVAPAPTTKVAAEEEHTQSTSPSPEKETPAPTTSPSLATGACDVKKPDQNDRAISATEAESSLTTTPDIKHKQSTQIPCIPDSEQQQLQQQPEQKESVSSSTKGERWVISSMRRPQQLPVRVQNVRMSIASSGMPSTILAPPCASSPPASATSPPAINNKFHRPNAPVKIEIPEKPPAARHSNVPLETGPQRHESLRQQIVDANGSYYGGNSNRTIKQNYGADLVEVNGRDLYGPASMATKEMYPGEGSASPTLAASTTSKKGPLSSFMKNIRKAESNRDSKRFSMNIFSSSSNKKDASKQMSLDEVFEQSEMISSNASQRHYEASHYPPQLEDGSQVIEYVSAMWPFDARIPSEMSFVEGDTMAVLHKQPDGWWLVELMDPTRRQRGLVPGNYMQSKKE
ncbi:hypothetical protein BX666DRAFT_1977295 [Dichotomocladium elegans]|nr:hypothetical protein BX666DRAFT_1977295 [Dichotomocladium elegans]